MTCAFLTELEVADRVHVSWLAFHQMGSLVRYPAGVLDRILARRRDSATGNAARSRAR